MSKLYVLRSLRTCSKWRKKSHVMTHINDSKTNAGAIVTTIFPQIALLLFRISHFTMNVICIRIASHGARYWQWSWYLIYVFVSIHNRTRQDYTSHLHSAQLHNCTECTLLRTCVPHRLTELNTYFNDSLKKLSFGGRAELAKEHQLNTHASISCRNEYVNDVFRMEKS